MIYIDILNESSGKGGNSELRNWVEPIPDGYHKHLSDTLAKYQKSGADRDCEGYKRLSTLVQNKKITYQDLKRVKNYFDNCTPADRNTIPYTLNGGDIFRNWVDSKLKEATGAVKQHKQMKKSMGFANAFHKPYNKVGRLADSKHKVTESLDEYTPTPYGEGAEPEILQQLDVLISKCKKGRIQPTEYDDLYSLAVSTLSQDDYENTIRNIFEDTDTILDWYTMRSFIEEWNLMHDDEVFETSFYSYLDRDDLYVVQDALYRVIREKCLEKAFIAFIVLENAGGKMEYEQLEDGNIYIERLITVDDINDVKFSEPGEYWCYMENRGYAYWTQGGNIEVRFRGRVSPINVDWGKTAICNNDDFYDEHEIILKPNAPIEIDEIVVGNLIINGKKIGDNINILKEPILINDNSGAVNESREVILTESQVRALKRLF